MSFLDDVQLLVLNLLNTQTKVNLTLFCEMEKVDLKTGEITSIEAPFLSKNETILKSTDTKEVFGKAKSKESLAKFQRRGCNWRFRRVVKLDINTIEYKPLRGNSYIPLPKKLASKKAIINMKNEDEQCFKWCVTRAFNPVKEHRERITEELKSQSKTLNWSSNCSCYLVTTIGLLNGRPIYYCNILQFSRHYAMLHLHNII